MENHDYLRYDTNAFTPPFRLGKKQNRAVLDANGKEVVIFPNNSQIQASLYVDYLNGTKTNIALDELCKIHI
jgi:hypothetical protein